MTIESFRMLDEEDQDELIFEAGLFIGNYAQQDYISDIYKISDFYVTIRYNLSFDDTGSISASSSLVVPS